MLAANSGLVLTRFKRPKKPRTLADDAGRIARHIKPLIGSTLVKDLDARLVRGMVADIAAGKTAADEKTKLRGRAMVRGGQTAAARVADLLSGIMIWAVDEEYAAHNRVHGVRRFRGEPRQRYLSDEELGRLGALLRDQDRIASGNHHIYALAVVELLCLTGCRLGEIADLKWSEIDFQDRCLRLADTKTGKSMRAVGGVVMDLLEAREREVSSDFVFPASRGEGAYTGTKRQAARIFVVGPHRVVQGKS